jgi:hypothetical protein
MSALIKRVLLARVASTVWQNPQVAASFDCETESDMHESHWFSESAQTRRTQNQYLL